MAESTDAPVRARIVATVEVALLLGGLGTNFFLIPHAIFGDGAGRFQSLTQLLEQGSLTESPYSMVGPLFSVPLYYLGKIMETSEWWCARFNIFVLACGLAATWAILRKHLAGTLVRRFLLLVLFASMFPNHLRAYYGEVFTAVFVGVGLLAVRFGHPYFGWPAVVLGVVNMPAALVALGIIALVLSVESKRLRFVVPLLVAAGLIMLEAWIRRGGPFVTGYEGNRGLTTMLPYSGRPEFSYPFFFGLISILLSFGKGLLFFAPGLLLGGGKRVRALSDALADTHRLWLWAVVGLILVYAKWWAWYGGWFWGPRYFLIASFPAAMALAVRLHTHRSASLGWNLATLGVLGWSFWVGANGAVFDNHALGETCIARGYALESLCWYVPEFSVLFRPFVLTKSLTTGEIAVLALAALVFVYLSAPQWARIGAQIVRAVVDLARTRLDPRAWRF